ncbi:MAG: helix-turn-helix transcriptional regulator [Gemmatimonadales bacterium]
MYLGERHSLPPSLTLRSIASMPRRPPSQSANGQRLRALRKRYGITQSEFATEFGVSRHVIARAEAGSERHLRMVADRMVAWLRGGSRTAAASAIEIDMNPPGAPGGYR